jgi:hypothetical protein
MSVDVLQQPEHVLWLHMDHRVDHLENVVSKL